MFHEVCGIPTCFKKVFIVYLKFSFTWVSFILTGNLVKMAEALGM